MKYIFKKLSKPQHDNFFKLFKNHVGTSEADCWKPKMERKSIMWPGNKPAQVICRSSLKRTMAKVLTEKQNGQDAERKNK
jgi:hypothetical protein